MMGKFALPSGDEMRQEMAAWTEREEALETSYEMIEFQADYVRELMKHTDYPAFDIELTVEEFKKWKKNKEISITGYRDVAHKSPVTGTLSPVHHTKWWEAMDDSMETFLATK